MKICAIAMAECGRELPLPVIKRKCGLIDESSATSICLAYARRIFHCYIGTVGSFALAKSNIKRCPRQLRELLHICSMRKLCHPIRKKEQEIEGDGEKVCGRERARARNRDY